MHLLPIWLARRLRLISGLVLFTYITTHLINHAPPLGIVSLTFAEADCGWLWHIAISIAAIALYGAAALHFTLALWTLYSRREWRLPLIEIVRLASGFSLPLILDSACGADAPGGRPVRDRADLRDDYCRPSNRQAAGFAAGAACPGLGAWLPWLWLTLRRSAFMRRLKPLLISILVLMPCLAAVGFIRMEAEVAILHLGPSARIAGGTETTVLTAWRDNLIDGYFVAIILAIVLGQLRRLPELSRRSPTRR